MWQLITVLCVHSPDTDSTKAKEGAVNGESPYQSLSIKSFQRLTQSEGHVATAITPHVAKIQGNGNS